MRSEHSSVSFFTSHCKARSASVATMDSKPSPSIPRSDGASSFAEATLDGLVRPLSRSPRLSFSGRRAADTQRVLSADEMRALGAVELGRTPPGAVTLIKLHTPLLHANYPFNLHERPPPFIPGDAVFVQMLPACMKLRFARDGDRVVIQTPPAAGGKGRAPPIALSRAEVANVKYEHVRTALCERLGPDTSAGRQVAVRLTGVGGLLVQLGFADRTLCGAFVKLLRAFGGAQVEVVDEAGVLGARRHAPASVPIGEDGQREKWGTFGANSVSRERRVGSSMSRERGSSSAAQREIRGSGMYRIASISKASPPLQA